MTLAAKVLICMLILASLGQISSCAELVFHNDRYNGTGNWGPTEGALRLILIWAICIVISIGIAITGLFLRIPTYLRVIIWCIALLVVPLICTAIGAYGKP